MLNNVMDNYFEDLSKIYESMDFQSSYDNYDPTIEKMKSEVNEISSYIEKYIKGTIAYYQNNREEFFKNPSNMTPLENLKGMFERLRPTLQQYSGFTRN
jgi:hypothetical protein